MTRPQRDQRLALVQRFFDEHLRRVRGASEHTIRAYRDALTLFFCFLAKESRRSVADLPLDDIRVEAVLAFLTHVESSRGNSGATRNCRLAAIRNFVEHLLRHDVARAEQYGRILTTPAKRSVVRPASYLEPEEARAVIAAVDPKASNGLRDRALLLLLLSMAAASASRRSALLRRGAAREARAVHARRQLLDVLHERGGTASWRVRRSTSRRRWGPATASCRPQYVVALAPVRALHAVPRLMFPHPAIAAE